MKTTPWAHQAKAIESCADRKSSLLAMDMGTGKSLVAINLAFGWDSKNILIICPLTVKGVWMREFEKHIPGRYIVYLPEGSSVSKTEFMGHKLSLSSVIDKPCVSIVNYDAVWREPLRDFVLNHANFDLVILDEVHRIKSAGGKASRFCYELSKRGARMLGLTGTPMPHSPLDIYGIYRTLDKEIYGTSFHRFKKRYALFGGYMNYKVIGYQNEEEFREKYESISFAVKKEDVLDLPEQLHVDIPVGMSDSTKNIYKTLEKEFYIAIEAGTITASNALVKGLRLQQLTSGFLKTDDGDLVLMGEEKKSVMKEIIEDCDPESCVVVFCRFRTDLDSVKDIAVSLKRQYGEISGSRKDLTDHAEIPEGIKVMGVQIQSGGVGIDLTRACVAIYFSLGFSLGDYLQSIARLHRPGQRHAVTFYHLIMTGTIDRKIYTALENRQDVIDSILKGD